MQKAVSGNFFFENLGNHFVLNNNILDGKIIMNKIEKYNDNVFEIIKHKENDFEYWNARELMLILEYTNWRNFKVLIKKAIESCKNSGINEKNHFDLIIKMVEIGSGAKRRLEDYKLTRYACYLIVQNGNPKKKVIALGQTYFAYKTRKQEVLEKEYDTLTDCEKRLYNRKIIKDKNKVLYEVAKKSGVNNFAKFTNFGYKGLYNEETVSDIKNRKGLSEKENILDYMGNEELGANIFRITQTEAKLKKDNINEENKANITHYNVGRAVRNTIKRLGATMPEKLTTPKKSIKELEEDKILEIK